MKYVRKVLDNGMNIIFVPDKNTQIVAMGFFVKAGSRNETDENSGVAHFLEHMMFKGTKNRTAASLFDELDSAGAVYNAVTTNQHTYYYIYGHMNSTKKLLDITLDIYLNPTFKTAEINRERKVILEEMGMRFDSTLMNLYSTMHKKIFKNTSLARDVIGSKSTLNILSKRDLIQFRNALYKPENTVFVISGNMSPQPLYQMIRRVLAPLPNLSIEPHSYLNEGQIILSNMKNQTEPYVSIKKADYLNQAYVLLAFPLYDLYSYKNNEIDLIAQLLSGGLSSRLNRALREEHGITYVSDSYPIIYSDCGIFVLQMILNPTELISGLKIMLGQLKVIKRELITSDELTKIINVSKNDTLYSLASPMDILKYFGINFLINREFKPDVDKELDRIKKITRDQIRATAREIFIESKINLFICGNVSITNYSFLDL